MFLVLNHRCLCFQLSIQPSSWFRGYTLKGTSVFAQELHWTVVIASEVLVPNVLSLPTSS